MRAAVSVRTCIGCRRTASPSELVRVTVAADGRLVVGPGAPGRGAWLCRGADGTIEVGCIDQATKRRAFGRALRAEVGAEAIEALRTEVTKRARIEGGRG
jgi:predicted RNA-binding protein YlxR (DUF448 family)